MPVPGAVRQEDAVDSFSAPLQQKVCAGTTWAARSASIRGNVALGAKSAEGHHVWNGRSSSDFASGKPSFGVQLPLRPAVGFRRVVTSFARSMRSVEGNAFYRFSSASFASGAIAHRNDTCSRSVRLSHTLDHRVSLRVSISAIATCYGVW